MMEANIMCMCVIVGVFYFMRLIMTEGFMEFVWILLIASETPTLSNNEPHSLRHPQYYTMIPAMPSF